MQKNKPNLFIVGTAKSGTTSLHYYLSQHPDIFMSAVKEPHFFANVKEKDKRIYETPKKGEIHHTRIITDLDIYLSLFETDHPVIYRGEASPSYFFDSNAAKKIYDFNPDATIIVLLREPVSRAFSHYKMDVINNIQNEKDFLKAVEKDLLNPDKMWGGAHLYIELGLYYEQLQRYSTCFPAKQLLVMKFEDLIADPLTGMKKVFEFLNLDINKIHSLALDPKNQEQYVRSHFLNRTLLTIKNNRLLNFVKSLVPVAIKKAIKTYTYSEPKKDGHNTAILLPAVKQQLNNTFFKKDKELLEKHYGILWDE